MVEILKVREDYGATLVRDMDGNFIDVDQLDNLIAKLIKTRNEMLIGGVDQATIQRRATDDYVAELARRSKLHYPIQHDYLAYRPGIRRGPKQPRFAGVYFLSFVKHLGIIKIGVSNDIYKRTKGLWNEYEHKEAIVHGYIETDEPYIMEASLHKRFAEHNVEGEWFETAPILAWLGEQS